MDNTTVNGAAKEAGFGQPIPAGIKLFFADAGLSTAGGLIVGILLGAAGATKEMLLYPSIVLGLLISIYIAFLLYRRYSKDITALVAMTITALIVSALSFPFVPRPAGFSQTQWALLILATIIGYGIGWYVAKTTKLKVFLFGRKWMIAFMVIGIITAFFELIGFVSFLAK